MLLWDARVAHEAAYEARIEAAFDQAEAHAVDGQLELAIESLSEAENLSGGLPDAYIKQREGWIASLAPLGRGGAPISAGFEVVHSGGVEAAGAAAARDRRERSHAPPVLARRPLNARD